MTQETKWRRRGENYITTLHVTPLIGRSATADGRRGRDVGTDAYDLGLSKDGVGLAFMRKGYYFLS